MNEGPRNIHTLTVLFDEACGLCGRLKQRLEREPLWIQLEFLALQDPSVAQRFPGVEAYQPENHLVVVDDQGGVYAGEAAWIMVLYATREYRELSLNLSRPGMRPLANVMCRWISNHRKRLSQSYLLRYLNEGHPV